jgi:hypothetical protein
MGENFLLQQVKNFRKGRDLAYSQLSAPLLIARPEVISTSYTARPFSDSVFQVNEVLYAQPGESDSHVDLVRGHRKVGQIGGESGWALGEVLREPGNPGIVEVVVSEVSPLTGIAHVAIKKD